MSRACASAFAGGFQAEMLQLRRSPLFLFLTVIQAITFLILVSLFALTGSFAPVALVSRDAGAYSKQFVETVASTHNSFDLRPMELTAAKNALRRGEIVGILTIPEGFSDAIGYGRETAVRIDIDNVNADMTEDVQRGLPSAIVRFNKRLDRPGIHVQVEEQDLIPHDTGFIAYLIVSGLVLNAFVIGGILSATSIAREFESGTARLWALAPVPAFVPLAGRASAATALSALAMLLPLAVAVFGYRIVPVHPLAAVAGLLFSTVLFSCLGVVLGALLRRTVPVASLIVGLSIPLYLVSGALEPERFDGDLLWIIGHFSPVYHSVGILEMAFHGLQVTPESTAMNIAALVCWMLGSLALAFLLLKRRPA